MLRSVRDHTAVFDCLGYFLDKVFSFVGKLDAIAAALSVGDPPVVADLPFFNVGGGEIPSVPYGFLSRLASASV